MAATWRTWRASAFNGPPPIEDRAPRDSHASPLTGHPRGSRASPSRPTPPGGCRVTARVTGSRGPTGSGYWPPAGAGRRRAARSGRRVPAVSRSDWGPLLRRAPLLGAQGSGQARPGAGMAPDGPVSPSQPLDAWCPSPWYIDRPPCLHGPPDRPPTRGAADGAIPQSGTASKLSWEPESPLFARLSGLSHRESDTPRNRNHPGI